MNGGHLKRCKIITSMFIPVRGVLKFTISRHFYSARHLVGAISLYLDFFCKLLFLIYSLVNSVVFVFDSINIVNRLLLCIYCDVCNAYLMVL